MVHKITFKYDDVIYETSRQGSNLFLFDGYEFKNIMDWLKYVKYGYVPVRMVSTEEFDEDFFIPTFSL